jgi:hypothetical protein
MMNENALSTGVSTHAGAISFPLPPVAGARASSSLFQRVCSFPVMLASLLVGVVFVHARLFTVDPDVWWHIKVGDVILRTHHWPTTDIYSFTVHGQPWLAYEWLGDVLLAIVYGFAGLSGLAVLSIFIGSAVVVALYACATERCGNSKGGFVAAALLSIFAVMSFSLRPQILGYLFLILTVVALERFRQGKRRLLWFFPLMMLLWVNTHGSWIIGMGTLLVYWLSGFFEFQAGNLEAKRWTISERCQLAGIFLLSLLTLPITPYGVRVAASPFEFALSLPLNVANIDEWQPMPFNMLIGKLFLVLLLAMIAAAVTSRFTWRLDEFLLFLFGTTMACLHVRFLLVFVPFAVPVIARMLSRWIPPYDFAKDKFALNAALMFLVAAGIFHYFPSRTSLQHVVAGKFPVAAEEYLKNNNVPEPMFNNYGFGGYMVLTRGPEHKVFIDGRGDVYERGGLLSDYLHIVRLRPGALGVLRAYGIQSCLIDRDEPLATTLAASLEWRRVYADDLSAIFVRTEPWK